jgi:uncharacterized protein (DUF433 family)
MSTLAETSIHYGEQDVPGIERIPGVCGGYPVLSGTRFPVRSIIEQLRLNEWGVAELLAEFPQLRREQVEAALTYFARHPDVINDDMRRNLEVWRELTRSDPDEDPALSG